MENPQHLSDSHVPDVPAAAPEVLGCPSQSNDAGATNSVLPLRTVAQAAHRSASALSLEERIAVLSSCLRPWDRVTAATFYLGGTYDTRDGGTSIGTWSEFGELLVGWSELVIPEKGSGPWFTPALSVNGRCRDEDIDCISMLSFDCDGAGDWDVLRGLLEAAGAAFILQRSSSHQPHLPKWHVHMPLATPWSGTKPQWRRIYRHAVGWFAGAAELVVGLDADPPSYGFDVKTDRLGQPWYPAARRAPEAPVPETIVMEGDALELGLS